jgi:hypothetical protein
MATIDILMLGTSIFLLYEIAALSLAVHTASCLEDLYPRVSLVVSYPYWAFIIFASSSGFHLYVLPIIAASFLRLYKGKYKKFTSIIDPFICSLFLCVLLFRLIDISVHI